MLNFNAVCVKAHISCLNAKGERRGFKLGKWVLSDLFGRPVALPMRGRIDDKSLENYMKRTDHTRDNWKVRTVTPPSNDNDLKQAANACSYVGSPYHKSYPSFAGMPRSRPRATKCPIDLKDQHELIECWLRNALMSGQVGALWEGGFPRYVWHREDDTVYEARQGSPGSGEYHGYPLKRNQLVRGLP